MFKKCSSLDILPKIQEINWLRSAGLASLARQEVFEAILNR